MPPDPLGRLRRGLGGVYPCYCVGLRCRWTNSTTGSTRKRSKKHLLLLRRRLWDTDLGEADPGFQAPIKSIMQGNEKIAYGSIFACLHAKKQCVFNYIDQLSRWVYALRERGVE
jgi:hypothetical protein